METYVHITLQQLVRLQYEAHGFSLSARQPVSSLLSGRHASRLRGRGLTFEELRGYRPGDDIRSMDWKATARLRKPQVRIYSEERERPVLLVVDQRTTMFFGSRRTTKATAATELAALAAWRALESGDRVGALIFGDREVVEIRPHRSRKNVLRVCHELTRLNRQLTAAGVVADSTTLNQAFLRAVNLAKHDHLVVMITDFAGANDETRKHATYLAAHNDVLAIMIYDPLGIQISARGRMFATDGNEHVAVPTDSAFQQRYRQAFEQKCDDVRQQMSGLRIPVLPISTDESVREQVLRSFGGRR